MVPAPHFWKIAAPRASFQLVPRPLPRCSRSNRILSTRRSLCEPGFCLLKTRTVSCPPPCHVEPPSCVCLCHVQSLPHRGCLPNFRTHPPFFPGPSVILKIGRRRGPLNGGREITNYSLEPDIYSLFVISLDWDRDTPG